MSDDRGLRAVRPVLLDLLRVPPWDHSGLSHLLEPLNGGGSPTWSDLLTSASYHGVFGMIDWSSMPAGLLPPWVQRDVQRTLLVQEVWHRHLMAGVESAAKALAAIGIKPCAVKGPILAERFYVKPAVRHAMDIDLLVDPAVFDRASEALTREGYLGADGRSSRYQRRFGHHVDFSSRGRVPIELHFRAYAGFGVEVGADALLDRATPFKVSETVSVLTPAPEDEFVYLATHAAGHSFIRLVWLYDLKMLLGRHPGLDWEVIAARAATLGVAGPVAYATRLLNEWLGVSLPPLPRSLQRRRVRARVADRLLAEVSRPQPRSVRDNLGGLLFMSLLCDRAASGAWLLQHHVLRSAKRRLHQKAPHLLPTDWSA